MSFVENKKAGLDFELQESFEAGIKLTGQEVKSLKQKHGSLDGARVIVRGGEVFIVGMFVPPYQVLNAGKDYDAHRVRKLLLSKKEIEDLYRESENKHLTMIPLSLYSKGLLIKIRFALGKRKTKGDKRESLKEKESKRDLRNISHSV